MVELQSDDDEVDRFVLEAYGVEPETEIMTALAGEAENHKERQKIEWDSVEQSPRHIGKIIERANSDNGKVALPSMMLE